MSKLTLKLIPVKNDVPGEPVEIPDSGLVLGRDVECDYVIDGDGVSRKHATFFWEGGALHVEDIESTNGVSVNGRLVDKRSKLKAGDVVQICAFDFVVGGPAGTLKLNPVVRIAVLAVILVGLIAGVIIGISSVAPIRTPEKAGTGRLSVLSSPPGAEIYDHGKKVGVTPYVFKELADGEYRLLLRMGGHKDKEVVMVVPQGGTRKIHAMEPVLIGDGYLSIRTLPAGAKVFVDDKPVGTTAPDRSGTYLSKPLKVEKVNLEVEHKVYVTHQGRKSVTYVTRKWEPTIDAILWSPGHVLVKRNGDVLLGMVRMKETDGTVDLAVSRTESVVVPASEIAELRTVLPPVFKQNKGVEKRKDANGVLELIVDPFPDDDE